MKVAIVHDWLTGMRGGERCLEAFLQLYPAADIFTLIHVSGATSALIDSRVRHTSILQRLPGVRRYYRMLLPLYPVAIRRFDFQGYDLVLSLSHAAAKNVTVPLGCRHICYCFSPMRYVWDQADAYFGRLKPLLWPIIEYLRRWDVSGSKRVDTFVAISRFVAARIRCYYRRSAVVAYPPVDTDWISPRTVDSGIGEAFLYAGALVPYKLPDVAVLACSQLGLPLWVVGSGPEEERLRRLAGPTIQFLGRLSDEELADRYRRCRALLFPGTEDFGMVPVECLAAGRPVIAHLSGGAAESLSGARPWVESEPSLGATGVFIDPTAKTRLAGLRDALKYFCDYEERFNMRSCTQQARKFSPLVFQAEWQRILAADPLKLGVDKGQKHDVEREAAVV